MVCAVNNLPSTGCGEEVELPSVDAEPMATTSTVDESDGGNGNFMILGGLLVAAAAIGLIVKNKKSA
jgi:hypothetical protein